ncbi:MAG: transglutaminase family protein [Pseudomonadota bacterium]
MRLYVRHNSQYKYEPAAKRVSLRLKLFPSVYDGQSVESWAVSVNGDPVHPIYTTGYGDETALWQSSDEVASVDVIAKGTVVTEDRSGVVKRLPNKPPAPIFQMETALTRPDDAIRKLAKESLKSDELETVHTLSHAVAEAVEYRPEVTNSKTTAAEALAIGAGVCQDHAHILMAASRYLGIPSRYVTGYLKAAEDADEMVETHAWAEVHIRNFGWVGLDPSNGISPTDHYIRIACGLDADDATPIKGHVVGESQITLSAEVAVTENQQQ